jgi:uncharacterized protein (DUF1810 family)
LTTRVWFDVGFVGARQSEGLRRSLGLDRHKTAQGDGQQAKDEMLANEVSHSWTWWTFPQLEELGTAQRSREFAFKDFAEQLLRTYLSGPVRGRLIR